jgi:hypothetical protein
VRALIDGDIHRYEIGFAAEAGWRAITEREEVPPWDYVCDLLNQRIAAILHADEAIDSYCLYLTEGRTFRFDIATTKPYKGTRIDKKPWHFKNISAYIRGVLPHEIVTYIEADDAMAIAHMRDADTIICSRDKDLRQVPGVFYSWELGKQPSFGPVVIDPVGWVKLSEDRKKLTGTGFAFFCSQMLTGDTVDNIPGLDGCGPVKAYEILKDEDDTKNMMALVVEAYSEKYDDWEERLLEQGRLCWIVREFNEDGSPKIWERGMYE